MFQMSPSYTVGFYVAPIILFVIMIVVVWRNQKRKAAGDKKRYTLVEKIILIVCIIALFAITLGQFIWDVDKEIF